MMETITEVPRLRLPLLRACKGVEPSGLSEEAHRIYLALRRRGLPCCQLQATGSGVLPDK